MWKRTELKKKSRALLRQHYWKAVSVCFVIAMLTTAYPVSTVFLSLRSGSVVWNAAGLLPVILYYIFINNLLLIGEKRFFMESHSYDKTMISKIFFLFKLRCLGRPAWIMFCRSIFQALWSLTIVGGIIKYYEYSMIPYILAENPRISRRDAFFLSRQLTSRNKRRLFLFDLSFAGWILLSVLTLGLLGFLFANPYITASRAELYLFLRRNYVLSRSPRYERLNDSCLEHVPSEDELLIRKALYDDSHGPYTKISYFAPGQYPVFLFSVQPPFCAVRSPATACRKYNICTMIFLFHAFSLFGWIWEMLADLICSGTFNSGAALFAPWVPLYGIYGVLILIFTGRLTQKPVVSFAVCFAVYSILEYVSNLASELLLGFPLHDYSAFLLNLHGRIYLGGSAAFALLGCGFVYFLAPKCAGLFERNGRSVRWTVCIVLTLLFVSDAVIALLRTGIDF